MTAPTRGFDRCAARDRNAEQQTAEQPGVHVAPLGSLSPPNVAFMAEALATIPENEARRRGAAHFAPQLQAYAARHGAANEAAA